MRWSRLKNNTDNFKTIEMVETTVDSNILRLHFETWNQILNKQKNGFSSLKEEEEIKPDMKKYGIFKLKMRRQGTCSKNKTTTDICIV